MRQDLQDRHEEVSNGLDCGSANVCEFSTLGSRSIPALDLRNSLSHRCVRLRSLSHQPTLEAIGPPGRISRQELQTCGKDDDLLVMLTFSGGGTRAAAFSYGVLEALRDTEISIHGRKKRMLDEVDLISGVSGGSFTAAYYGLFGDRIFEDFESRFLKKNIQGDLVSGILFNPVNWAKLSSPYYARSDLAADYYDKYVFDHGTFGDILAHGGPMIVINATDMTLWNTVFLYSRSLRCDLLGPLLFLRGPCMRRLLCSTRCAKPRDLAELRRQVWLSVAPGARGGHATPKGRYVAPIRSCQ